MEQGTPYLLASAAACQGEGDLTLELGSLCFSQMVLIDLVNLLLLAIYISSLLIAACKREFRVIRARDLPFSCAVASPCCALLGIACVCLGLGAWGSSPHGTPLFVRGFVWASLSVSLVVRPTRFSGALAMAWWAVDAILITANCLEKTLTGGNLGVLDVMSWAVGFCFCGARSEFAEASPVPPPATEAAWSPSLSLRWEAGRGGRRSAWPDSSAA